MLILHTDISLHRSMRLSPKDSLLLAEFCCIHLIKLTGTTNVIADTQVFKDALCQLIKLLKLVV